MFATYDCLLSANFVKLKGTKHKNKRFGHFNIFILHAYATVDFSIVLLKIILVTCVHKFKTIPCFHFSEKMKTQYDFVFKV